MRPSSFGLLWSDTDHYRLLHVCYAREQAGAFVVVRWIALQRQKAVSAHFASKQILPFVFARRATHSSRHTWLCLLIDPCSSRLWPGPSGWNRFQPQIDPVQNRGTFLWTVISKTCLWIIRSKIVFLEPVIFQLRGRMVIFRTFVRKLWTFFGPWGRDRSQSPPCWKTLIFLGKTNTAIHGLREDVKATSDPLNPHRVTRCHQLVKSLCSLMYQHDNATQQNTRRWPNVGLMLAQRRRRWANIKPTLGERMMFVEYTISKYSSTC